MKSFHTALAIGVSAVALASAAHATVDLVTLTEGTGWHYGQSNALNSPHMFYWDIADGNEFKLTVKVTSPAADLSFVDGYVPGDVYLESIKSVGGTVTYKSQFLGAGNFDTIPHLYAGPFGSTFGPAWLSSSYGHIQANLTAGTYTVLIKETGGIAPAGWGIRLDAVPEPETWALMLVGFGALGAAVRGRRRASALG